MATDKAIETQMANTTNPNILNVFIFETNFSEYKPSLTSEIAIAIAHYIRD
jgi:hypothetical protein